MDKMQSNSKFLQNEVVLCYEPDPAKARMLYEAKILDVDVTKDEKGKKVSEYYVHFQGWNKSWDRWVLEDQLLRNNDSSKTLQSRLYQEVIKPRKRKHKSSRSEQLEDDVSVASTASGETDDGIKSCQLPRVTLDIPKILANRLEDDCYSIKRKKKLIRLPRKPSVKEILKGYFEHCQKEFQAGKSQNQSLQIVEELLEGLHVYFNFYVGNLLLYNFEKEQYRNLFPVLNERFRKDYQSSNSSCKSNNTPAAESSKMLSKNTKNISNKNLLGASTEDLASSNPSFKNDITPGETSKTLTKNTKNCFTNQSLQSSAFKSTPVIPRSDRCLRNRNNSQSISKKQQSPKNSLSDATTERETTSKSSMETRSLLRRPSLKSNTSAVKDDDVKSELSDSNTTVSEQKNTDDDTHSQEHLENDVGVTTRLRRSSRKVPIRFDEVEEIDTLPIGSTAQSLNAAQIKRNELKPLPLKSVLPIHAEVRSHFPFPRTRDGKIPSDIYGPEHLLRLFVKLPILLAASNIEEEKLKLIIRHISLFLDYLALEHKLFVDAVHTESVV